MRAERKKLNDVFPLWISGGGIFSALQAFPVPWQTKNIGLALDLEYHGNMSGEKYISPLVDKIRDGDTLTTEEKTMLCTAIMAVCGTKWQKEYDTLSFEYNPIENYDMTEIMSDDLTETTYGKTTTHTNNLSHTKTGTETEQPNVTETTTNNLTHGKTGTETERPDITETTTNDLEHSKSGTETGTPNTTETTTPNLTRNTDISVYGFNSSGAVNSDKNVETSTGTQTTAKTGSDTMTYDITETDGGTVEKETTGLNTKTYNTTDSDTGTSAKATTGTNTTQYNTTDSDTGTQTDADTGTDSTEHSYTLTRSGNIGVTTSQQMIESERNLWMWDFFYKVVFPDVNRILTLSIY